ncbi:translocator protein [Erythrolamprus reginae]|uniref:translocator protein n=1 Tax=Erythrolamprus reginae TaxID=121349 RepID=UPI00396CD179
MMEGISSWIPAIGLTILPNIGGFLGASVVRRAMSWYRSLKLPPWRPPNWVFGPVWGILYTSMGYGSYLIWRDLGGLNQKSFVPLGLYVGQLALNWCWTPIFFGQRRIGLALVVLFLTTGAATATTVSWYHVNRFAACLMYPYIAWLMFALLLNFTIWKDNPHKKNQK